MFVSHHFSPQKQAFLSPEVPEGQKMDKNMSLSYLGDNRGTKLTFCALLILIAKLFYLVVIQRVSRWFVLKIIDLYYI